MSQNQLRSALETLRELLQLHQTPQPPAPEVLSSRLSLLHHRPLQHRPLLASPSVPPSRPNLPQPRPRLWDRAICLARLDPHLARNNHLMCLEPSQPLLLAHPICLEPHPPHLRRHHLSLNRSLRVVVFSPNPPRPHQMMHLPSLPSLSQPLPPPPLQSLLRNQLSLSGKFNKHNPPLPRPVAKQPKAACSGVHPVRLQRQVPHRLAANLFPARPLLRRLPRQAPAHQHLPRQLSASHQSRQPQQNPRLLPTPLGPIPRSASQARRPPHPLSETRKPAQKLVLVQLLQHLALYLLRNHDSRTRPWMRF